MKDKYLCDIDGCENECTHMVSHDTRYDSPPPLASCVSRFVCEEHIQGAIDEFIEEFGEPDGKKTKIRIDKARLYEYICSQGDCIEEAKFCVDMEGGGATLCEEHLWKVLDSKAKYGYLGQTKLTELKE